jgi:hypothetical protein
LRIRNAAMCNVDPADDKLFELAKLVLKTPTVVLFFIHTLGILLISWNLVSKCALDE